MVRYKSMPRLGVKMVMGSANMLATAVFFYLLKNDVHGKNVVGHLIGSLVICTFAIWIGHLIR
jgi:hypothetical protein